MITAPVLNAVQQLLHERGIEKRPDERLADYVARGLRISHAQAERLLEALHENKTLEQAQAEAGIVPGTADAGLLTDLARWARPGAWSRNVRWGRRFRLP
jgi:hypothetical protein